MDTKTLINARIEGALKDLANFHSNTFDFDLDSDEENDIKFGKEIERNLNDLEMTKEMDASYILGTLDAYRDILRMIKKQEKNFLEETLSNTTEINNTRRTIEAFLDDKGNEFLTAFYDDEGFLDYIEIYEETGTKVISGKEAVQILENVKVRQKEL